MVSEDGPWDLRPFTAWIADEYLPSLLAGPAPAGYSRRPGISEPDVYGVGDVACILYTLGDLEPGPAWLEALARFQDSATGFFVSPSSSLTTAHNTGFAVGAMNLFQPELRNGMIPAIPILFGEMVAAPADAERFASMLDWRNNCYEAGEILIGHASTFFNVAGVVPQSWFEWLVEFVESTKLDPANGMAGVGKPPGGDGDQIGGTFHFDFFWEALGQRLPFADARAEALLGLQQPDGLWDDDNPWWLTFDAIYMLGRTIPDVCGPLAGSIYGAMTKALSAVVPRAMDEAKRKRDFVDPWIGAHMLTGAISLFAYAQLVLGTDVVVTDRPLQLVLERRPYI